jgi:hypothetical protein
MVYSIADLRTLDTAGDQLLRSVGLPSGAYPRVFSDIFNSSTTPMAFYVDATLGSDSNSGLTPGVSGAFKSIAAAVSMVPHLVAHNIVINIAAGHYTGCQFSGFTFQPASPTELCMVQFIGTRANVTPATGTATGTLSSAVTGALASATFTTVTDNTQTWTVNDPALVGKMYAVNGSTSQRGIIASNTATTLTLVTTVACGTAGSAYTITAPATIIDTAIGNALGPLGGQPTISYFQGIRITQCTGTLQNIMVNIQDISFEIATGTSFVGNTNILVEGAYAQIDGCNFTNGCGYGINVTSNARADIRFCNISCKSGFASIVCNQGGFVGGGTTRLY